MKRLGEVGGGFDDSHGIGTVGSNGRDSLELYCFDYSSGNQTGDEVGYPLSEMTLNWGKCSLKMTLVKK